MDDTQEKVLFSIKKSESDEVKVRETNFKGKDYIDIRIYSKIESGDIIPTKKGVTLSKEKMKELIEKLNELEF